MVRDGQSEPEQADDGADQAFGLAQSEAEHGPERQPCQDCQRRVPGLPARDRARLCPPPLDRVVREPNRQAAALAQGRIMYGRVRELVFLLRDMVAGGPGSV